MKDLEGDTTRDKLLETESALESCTLVVNEKAPAEVGVPAMVPVGKFSVRPAGSCPLMICQR